MLFEYNFFTYAVLASLFASITCGIMGVYIVSRRMVFIAGGLTHSSFGGIGLGYFFGFSPIAGAAMFAVFAALGIENLTQRAKLRNDSAIALLWAFGMALGITLIYLTPGYAPNLMSYLFGSILTVTSGELIFMALLSVTILFVFTTMFRSIQFISFDEEFARSQKIKVSLINNLMMALVALVIVLNIKVAGVILILSLLTIPQNIANLFTSEMKKMMVSSTIIAFVGSLAGLMAAFYLNIPAGAAIILFLTIMYFLVKIMIKSFRLSK